MRRITQPKRIRIRIGRVSIYLHHTSWWIYFRENGKAVRQRVGPDRRDAEKLAAQVHARLAMGERSPYAFTPIAIAALRSTFLDFHQSVLRSAPGTVNRYRSATKYLEGFAVQSTRPMLAHEIVAESFIAWLRRLEVAPNGHPNSPRRPLRDKGVLFILETCRSLLAFAIKQRHFPPYAENPFSSIPFDRLKVEDAKPIFVFDQESEVRFLSAADPWEFSIHFTLAKTGLRVGELCHLLIDDVDFDQGWLHVRNKPDLGWKTKTRSERSVPLISELVTVLRFVVGNRRHGPLFLQRRFHKSTTPPMHLDGVPLSTEFARRLSTSKNRDPPAAAKAFWREMGAIDGDDVRRSFTRLARRTHLPAAKCPKSWRHTFATLLQDANVDPLIRQLTLGHSPAARGGLGMTANYTQTRKNTLRTQIETAIRLWPRPLQIASEKLMGDGKHATT